MTQVHVEWETEEAVILLKQISTRTLSFRPPFIKAREVLNAAWAVNAASGGLPSGGWKPEKPGTWSADGALARLHHTGALEAALAGINGSGRADDIGSHRAVFGIDGTVIPYAKFHQYGTEHMPSRKIIFQPPFFAYGLARDVADYLVDNTWEVPGTAMFRSLLP